MLDYDTGDVVLLQLADASGRVHGDPPPDVAPPDVAIPGISAALEVSEERISERVSLLSALEDLKRAGLVEERQMRVQGLEGERNVYRLTEAGLERARKLRDRLARETVVVRNGEDREVTLGEVDEYLPDPALPRALSRLTEDRVLYLEEEVGQRFVNRESELATLRELLDGVTRGRARTVLVGGEAGVGKTTLVTDELAGTASEEGVRVSVGRCQVDATEPYGPVREAMEEYLAENPFVREGPDPADATQFEARRAAMFGDVVEAVAAASEDAPLLLVVDDLHAADESTLALFEYLAEHLVGRVLLVGTYRPEDLPADHTVARLVEAWPEAGDAPADAGRVHLPLDLFGRDETRQLVEWLVGRRGVPASFVDLVFELTAGNPLFVKESVTRLLQDGTVDPEHDIYPEDTDGIPVSEEVEDTIDIRLSVLGEKTREILDLGGVIGQSIPFDVLSAATDIDDPQLREHVDLLVDSHLWERAGGSDERLRFASGLTRETVFDRIDDGRRRELHARIADAVADRHGDDPDFHATIAHHYRQAGDPERAFEFYVQAADHAKDVYAHEVALDNYDRALELARDHLDRPEDDGVVVDVLTEFAETYYLLGEYEEADRYYRYVADRATDPEQLRRVAHVRMDMFDSQGRYGEALAVAEAAIEEYGVADTRESCHLFGLKGGAHLRTGDFDAAEEAFQRCLEIAERIDEPEALASAYLDLGALDIVRGEADEETLDLLERAVSVAEEGDDDRPLARALNNLAMLYNEFGRLEEAEGTLRRCLELRDEMGDRVQVARAYRRLGALQRDKGAFDRAIKNTERATKIADEVEAPQITANNHRQLRDVYHATGRMDAAMEHGQRAYEIARELDNPDSLARTVASLADSHLDGGEFERARELAHETVEAAEEAGSAHARWSGLVVLGGTQYRTGDPGAAHDSFRRALDAAGEIENARHSDRGIALTNARLSEVSRALGDLDGATDHADAAVQAAEALGDEATLARARLQRGAIHRINGEFEDAEGILTDVLAVSRQPRHRAVFIECRTLLELARLELDRGDEAAAREYAETARELIEGDGVGRFRPLLEAVEADLDGGEVTE